MDPRDTPDHMTSISAYTAGGIKRKGVIFKAMVFIIPNNFYVWWNPVFLGMAEYLLPVARIELIPCFDLLACTTFAFPI